MLESIVEDVNSAFRMVAVSQDIIHEKNVVDDVQGLVDNYGATVGHGKTFPSNNNYVET